MATYRYIRWTITQPKGATSIVQFDELELRNGGSAAAWNGSRVSTNPGGSNPGGEGPDQATDGSLTSKMLDFNFGSNGYTILLVDNTTSITFDGYRFATGNDATERDPIGWTLEGSNDGSSWTTLDTLASQTITDTRDTWSQIFAITAVPTGIAYGRNRDAPGPGKSASRVDMFRTRPRFITPGTSIALSGIAVSSSIARASLSFSAQIIYGSNRRRIGPGVSPDRAAMFQTPRPPYTPQGTSVALTGLAVAGSAATGAMSGAASLAGLAVVHALTAGNLLGSAALSGIAASSTTSFGAMTGSAVLSGVAVAQSAALAGLTATATLSGISISASTTWGDLQTAAGPGALSGLAIGSSSSIGAMSAVAPLSGLAAAQSLAQADLLGSVALVGLGVSSSTATGNLLGSADLSGISISHVAATGAMSASAVLSGLSITGSHARGYLLGGGAPVFPDPADVKVGVVYGPTGVEYTGTRVDAGGGSYVRRR